MIDKTGNLINNIGGKNINNKLITNKNIYSKIAPPNTFKRRTSNKIEPKILQRYEKNSQTNQISNPFINYKADFTKRSSLILNNQNIFIPNADSDSKLPHNINSSFRDKIKIIKGNLFNNNESYNIISPKKTVNDKMRININNKNLNNAIKMPNKYIIKYKSVYSKKGKNLKRYDHILNKDEKSNNIHNNIKNNKNINEENDFIKDKYDYLLERTKNLLLNYQQIVNYYQEKEKKIEFRSESNL